MVKVWKFGPFGKEVALRHGEETAKEAALFFTSIDWKIAMANFHIGEASKLFDQFFDVNENRVAQVFRYISGQDERSNAFYSAKISHEAHLIAASQAVYSIADLLGQIVNLLGFFCRKPVEDVSFRKVIRWLPPSTLREEMEQLDQTNQFNYLSAFVNVTKHRSLVFSNYHADLSDRDKFRHGVRYKEFVYRGRNFEKKWSTDFVTEMVDLMGNYVAVGLCIDEAFFSQAMNIDAI